MPIYEYMCNKCGHSFELFVHSISDSKITICPKCGTVDVKKLLSGFMVEKKYPILGSKGSNFAAGSVPLKNRRPGFKRKK